MPPRAEQLPSDGRAFSGLACPRRVTRGNAMRMTGRRTLAYVIPVFNEAETLEILHARLSEVAARLEERYEVRFVYVDDGSRDESLRLLHSVAERDARVTVVQLARNFGHQVAVTAGLDI